MLLTRFHLAQVQSRIGLHDKNIRTILTDLNGAARHKHRILQRLQDQSHMHKLRRPQRAVVILSGSARSHRACARLHRVVDERKLANARGEVVVLGFG